MWIFFLILIFTALLVFIIKNILEIYFMLANVKRKKKYKLEG